MLQLPTPTAVDSYWTSVREQAPHPSETLTVPVGQTVPLAGVTETWTLSVVPCQVDVCVVPVIAVVVSTKVGPAYAVPGVSRTPPTRPPASTTPVATPAPRRQAARMNLCIDRPFHPSARVRTRPYTV